MSKKINLKGQIFNRWTVLGEAPSRGKDAYWICQCQCGTIREVNGYDLRHNKSKSCGCLQKEILSQKRKNILTNQQFGLLTALYENGKDIHGNIIWHCQCKCGNKCNVRSTDLIANKVQSCGCIMSRGEEKISTILKENNILYESQKTFDDCRNTKTNNLFRFDFYVNNQYIIEYDGIQHFKALGSWNTKEQVKETQEHDNIKNQYCKEHNIPIIRIPYTHLNNLCLEDLLLETTTFLVR